MEFPFQIEGVFAPGGTLEMDSALVEGRAGHTVFLKAGYALYRVGADAIRIGPGAMEHTMWRMRNSEIDEERLRVLIAAADAGGADLGNPLWAMVGCEGWIFIDFPRPTALPVPSSAAYLDAQMFPDRVPTPCKTPVPRHRA